MNYTTPKVVIVLITAKDVLTSSTDGYTLDYFNDENWRGGEQ
jgi:hypothetical protein